MTSPAVAGLSPVPGMTPAHRRYVSGAQRPRTATSGRLADTRRRMSEADKNFFIDNFKQGGPIMWPILLVSLTALAVVLERVFWWLGRWMRRDPKRIEKVFTAIEVGDVAEASRLSRDSRDPVLRMMWNGLESPARLAPGRPAGGRRHRDQTRRPVPRRHGYAGHPGAFARFAGNDYRSDEIVQLRSGTKNSRSRQSPAVSRKRSSRRLAVWASRFLRLIPFNFFTSRVSNLEFELQTAATNLEVMLEAQNKAKREMEISGATPSSATRSSI